MKASKYNYIVKEEDGSIIMYNGMTGALCVLNEMLYEHYCRLASTECTSDLTDTETDTFVKNLRRGGYIINDDTDEVEHIRKVINGKRFSEKSLGLTIAPTMDCNFSCPYCFEGEKNPEYMDAETEKSIIRYVEYITSLTPGLHVAVTWFGGEPTLALDTIYRLSDSIMEIVKKYHGSYSASIVTNGYLLDGRAAEELAKRCVKSAQVTIDGYPELHNKRRCLKNGEGTFDIIVKNLKETVEFIKNISIRVNMDNENIADFPKFLDAFEEAALPKYFLIAPSRVDSHTKACQSVSESVVGVPEFSKERVKILKMIIDRKMFADCIPQPYQYSCCAIRKNSFLIHPTGDIYKCWNTIGDKRECLGNINDRSYSFAADNKWTSYDPVEDDKCLKCSIFPVCMSNCPYLKLGVEAYSKPDSRCSEWKYNLPDIIKLISSVHKLWKADGSPGIQAQSLKENTRV